MHTPILASVLETVADSAKHGIITWHSKAPRHRLSGRIFNCLNRILLSGTDTEWWTDSESAVNLGLTKDQYVLSRNILTSMTGATIAIPVFSVPDDLPSPVFPDIPLSGEEIIESLNLKISSGTSEIPRYLHSTGTVQIPVSAPADSLPMDECLLSCIRYVTSVMPDELHDHLLTPVTEDLALWQMLALTGSQRNDRADDEALCCLLADLSLTDTTMQKRFIRAVLRAEECIRILINTGENEAPEKVLPEDVTFILTEKDRRTFAVLLSGTHTTLRQKKQIKEQLKRLSAMLLSGRILRYRMTGNAGIEFYVTGYKNGIFTGKMTLNGTTYFGESLDYTQMRNFELDLSWEPPEVP